MKINTISQENRLPEVSHPDWVKDAVIYEVNIRQFTPEGTFNAFEKHIPRLKELGVDIIWLMPIHPIGERDRKGTLGSYYSVKDYRRINPEFGNEADFRHLVTALHEADMKVIIDWVANHSSWDNWLTKKHPEWYQRKEDGQFVPPIGLDWSDVIAFDYSNQDLRQYMKESMVYWVEQFDIDGYRCDVAGFVPIDFWIDVRQQLEAIKPVFMLAEWEDRLMHLAFDMTYAWELEEAMRDVAEGQANASKINAYIVKQINSTNLHEIQMPHTSNHDKNAWEGTVFERFGKAAELYVVLSYIVEGMPLIYGGQEVGLNRALSFFDKDEISWGDHPFNSLYSRLNKLKKDNRALWNGDWGARMIPLMTNAPDQVCAILREKEGNKVLGLFNCSSKPAIFSMQSNYSGDYKSFKSRSTITLTDPVKFELAPWGYEVFIAKQAMD